MKKIAVMSSASKLGGTELSALRICKLLKNRGNDVVYISPGSVLQKEMEGIRSIYYKLSRKNPFSLVLAVFTISRIVKNEKIQVLHCQDAMSCVLCCYAKKYLGMTARIIWHERGIHYKSYTTMTKRYSSLIDMIICNSYNERTLLMLNRCNPDKIKVIYNAFEPQIPTKTLSEIRDDIGILEGDFVVGSVGRQSWEKGFSTLISAVEIAKNDIPNLKLLLVGSGEMRQNLENSVEYKKMSDYVIFAGFRRDVPNMLAAMDVFSIPSWYEAFGNVTVEAMLAKKPVIGSRVGGIQEVIQDGINGWLVPSADAEALAEKIIHIYNNSEQSEIMVQKAYHDACERYNFDVYYEKIMDVYNGRT